jgi:SAM-dependent methyltransferase
MASDLPNREGTDMWNARYAGDDYFFGIEPNRFLVEASALLPPGGRVLCVADGEGRNSVWLAGAGFAVDAFDPSPVAVEKARRLAAERGVSPAFAVAGVDDWAWPEEAYDGVAAIYVQFAPPDMRRRLFDRVWRALRPGGLFLLAGYQDRQLEYGTGGPRVVEQLYTEEQLRAELSAFAIERLSAYDALVKEGRGHAGMSALIDVVARRPGSPA